MRLVTIVGEREREFEVAYVKPIANFESRTTPRYVTVPATKNKLYRRLGWLTPVRQQAEAEKSN